jgi:hypothetical protein
MLNSNLQHPDNLLGTNQTHSTVNQSSSTFNPTQGNRYITTTTTTKFDNKDLNNMRVSHLYEHNQYQDTDRLYEPLRGVILSPENTVYKHMNYIPEGARVSHVSHQYHNFNEEELRRLVT